MNSSTYLSFTIYIYLSLFIYIFHNYIYIYIYLLLIIIQGNRNPYQLAISNTKNDVCKYLLEVHTEREQVLKANAKVNK